MTDVLSQVLEQVHLAGAVLFRARLRAPWCIATRPESVLANQLGRASIHVITFHVVLDGRLWISGVPGVPGQWVCAGQAVVLPHGDPHVLGDATDGAPVAASALWGQGRALDLCDVCWGGDGAGTRVLCGYLGCRRDAFAPLFAALPALFCVPLGPTEAEPALDPLLAYAEHQIATPHPGAGQLRLRMAELIFVEALRRYMQDLAATQSGWLAGLRDPVLGRALALLHAAPERAWDVETLAREAATSRSILAERFSQVIGEPPMRYLARWRMLLAARRLREGRDSIATVAEAVGYESAAAFQRAFKREFAITPAQARRAEELA